ncbi:MAG: serine/threonine protein kinase [Xanthomonadales bacterium PRO7]|nr:serine/threonine protein kinase [Xanthomonadales bacterium PRO7]
MSRFQRLQELFDAAVLLAPEARARFLDDACAADAELRAELEGLLAADARAHDPLAASVAHGTAEHFDDTAPWLGRRIGNYRILRELGRGGMGSVFLAERADAEYESRVAIKLIRGFPTSAALERLRRERQLLAGLVHPHIARLLDGGTTDEGQPYLVMEYVNGVLLAQWLDANRPPLAQRLRLFQQLCAAVHHAHQNLIVHSDLKPANVMVRRDGTPALLDFGIARLNAPDANGERATELRAFTPDYASPEQLGGAAVTTASDVYALGLILYELLCGKVYKSGRNAESWRQARPGRVARTAEQDWLRADAPRIDGDLEHVVRRALDEDPARRYPSAAALADDIERYFDGRALAAGPDRIGYRVAKFVRRHRLGVGIAALALAAIIGVAAWLAVERTRALRAQAQARSEAHTANAVTDFLVGLFQDADPQQTRGHDVSARELLDQASARLDAAPIAQTRVQARLLTALGEIYISIGQPRRSTDLLGRAIVLLRAPGSDPLRLARALNEDCRAWSSASDHAKALPACREAIALRATRLPNNDADVGHSHNALGVAEQGVGDFDAAERDYRAALSIFSAAGTAYRGEVASTLHNLGFLAFHRGDYARARDLYTQALAGKRAVYGNDDPRTLTTLDNLAQAEEELGDLAAAERNLSEALTLQIKVLGADSIAVARAHNDLASVQQDRGEYAAAETNYRAALDLDTRLEPPGSMSWAVTANNLATLEEDRGDYAAALPLFRESLRIREVHNKSPSASVARVQNNLARCELELGNLAAARPFIDATLATRRALKLDPAQLLDSQLLDAQWLVRSGRLHEAAAALHALTPPDGRGNYGRRARYAIVQAELAASHHDWTAALAAQRRALDALHGELGEQHPAYARLAAQAAAYAHAGGDDAAARSLLQPALPIIKASLVEHSPQRREAEKLAAVLKMR